MPFMIGMAVVSLAAGAASASAADSAAQTGSANQRARAMEQQYNDTLNANERGRIESSQIERELNNTFFNKSFNEEAQRFNAKKADLDFLQRFSQRLDGYNKVRSTQLASIGYQGRTVSSLKGINTSQEEAFKYDNEVDELNRQMVQFSIDLSGHQTNLNMMRDIESAYSNLAAVKAGQGQAVQNANLNAGQSIASANSEAAARSSAAWGNFATDSIGTIGSTVGKYGKKNGWKGFN